MKTTMTISVETQCPIDDAKVPIEITVFVGDGFLKVEDLIGACKEASANPATQEEFTRVLAELVDFPIKTVGIHSCVTITCEVV